jgi:hypothetical protein
LAGYPDLPLGSGFTKKINFKSCPQWLHLIPGISGSGFSKKSSIISWMSEMSSRISSMDKRVFNTGAKNAVLGRQMRKGLY